MDPEEVVKSVLCEIRNQGLASTSEGMRGAITACHLTFAGQKAGLTFWPEIIRTRLNVWQFLDWSDTLSDHFRKVIIPTASHLPHQQSLK